MQPNQLVAIYLADFDDTDANQTGLVIIIPTAYISALNALRNVGTGSVFNNF
jgi:hypothetical protein